MFYIVILVVFFLINTYEQSIWKVIAYTEEYNYEATTYNLATKFSVRFLVLQNQKGKRKFSIFLVRSDSDEMPNVYEDRMIIKVFKKSLYDAILDQTNTNEEINKLFKVRLINYEDSNWGEQRFRDYFDFNKKIGLKEDI
jgi:hypothetical protein